MYYGSDHKFLQNSFGFLLAYLIMSILSLTVLWYVMIALHMSANVL